MGSGFAQGVGPLPHPFLTAFHGPGPIDRGAWLFPCLFGVGGNSAGGGRRLDAKRPEKRGAGGFAFGPRFLFGGEGAALGAAPSPAKRRRPQAVLPVGRGGRRRFSGRGRRPRPEKQARCRAKPGSGRVGCAHPPPPPTLDLSPAPSGTTGQGRPRVIYGTARLR